MTHPPGNPPSDPGTGGGTGPGRLALFVRHVYDLIARRSGKAVTR